MRKLLIGILFSTFLFGQGLEGAFSNFFKYSTVYAGFNITSPKWEEDRYRLSMINPETGEEDWYSGELTVEKEERNLEPDFDLSFGLRKIGRFQYEPKRGVKNAGNGGEWYKGNEVSPNEAATVGRVKGFEYLIKYSENRRWDEQFTSEEYFIRYLSDWFILKLKYQDMEMEDLQYGQGDVRFRKEFGTDFGSINLSIGVGARAHPAYGFAPTVIDSSWYTSSWWEFASDEFGVEDRGYMGDTDGDGVGDGGMAVYDNQTGEYIGYVGWDWRWFDADGNVLTHTDREFYTYHFPGMLESWFSKQLKGLGTQRELSVSVGLDWYQYTENFWIHAWGSLYPYHYGLDKYSFHNAKAFEEHETQNKSPESFEFLEAGTSMWFDYDFGGVIGFKLQENLGFYVEGKYLNYWERPAYDLKVGLNYQFVGL